MSKKLIWTDEQLNSYGFRVLTSGIELSRFEKNPIMLFNHHRSDLGKKDEILPIGIWKEYAIGDDGTMSGVPVFDMNDEFAATIAAKVEGGFLTACSIGIRVIEVSEDPRLMLPGQTRPTVTRCELREVSIVDIPANPNAAGVVLYDDCDKVIELTDDEASPVRLIHKLNTIKPMKEIVLKLGLPEDATADELAQAIERLHDAHVEEVKKLTEAKEKAEAEVKRLTDEKIAEQQAEAAALVDQAVKAGKISADLKASYLRLFESDFAATKAVLCGMPARKSLAARTDDTECRGLAALSWDEIDRAGRLAELREHYPDLYAEKYREMSASLIIM